MNHQFKWSIPPVIFLVLGSLHQRLERCPGSWVLTPLYCTVNGCEFKSSSQLVLISCHTLQIKGREWGGEGENSPQNIEMYKDGGEWA